MKDIAINLSRCPFWSLFSLRWSSSMVENHWRFSQLETSNIKGTIQWPCSVVRGYKIGIWIWSHVYWSTWWNPWVQPWCCRPRAHVYHVSSPLNPAITGETCDVPAQSANFRGDTVTASVHCPASWAARIMLIIWIMTKNQELINMYTINKYHTCQYVL